PSQLISRDRDPCPPHARSTLDPPPRDRAEGIRSRSRAAPGVRRPADRRPPVPDEGGAARGAGASPRLPGALRAELGRARGLPERPELAPGGWLPADGVPCRRAAGGARRRLRDADRPAGVGRPGLGHAGDRPPRPIPGCLPHPPGGPPPPAGEPRRLAGPATEELAAGAGAGAEPGGIVLRLPAPHQVG